MSQAPSFPRTVYPYTLPYLQTTEHGMPMSKLVIWGNGILFTQTITDGLRAGGLWLVMQDKCGTAAVAKGDIIMLAHIDDVDWLSACQIKLDLTIQASGVLRHDATPPLCSRLQGDITARWPDLPPLPEHDILLTRLKQGMIEHHFPLPASSVDDWPRTPNWVCWRWLEILPIPLATKQRLLKHPTPHLCMRYIKKIIRHGDLSAQPLR
ncbi:hypothetical protein L4C36_17580 [Photobacterium japonica]|uniref:hypothetical protein n=1 Tax=Photobacterium japonica TaxID=2910235 RepID=UPI003D0B974F